jgi:hypothetical protein
MGANATTPAKKAGVGGDALTVYMFFYISVFLPLRVVVSVTPA